MKWLIFTLTLVSTVSLACKIEDFSDIKNASHRKVIFENLDNPGVRISIFGMKDKNNDIGLGGVNNGIAKYETKLCKHFGSKKFMNKYKDVSIQLRKMDFKGYYITCMPMPRCLEIVEAEMGAVPKVKYRDGTDLVTTYTVGESYPQGYIKSRIKAVYPNYTEPLEEFIENEFKAGIKDIIGTDDPSKFDPTNKDLKANLMKNIDLFRGNKLDEIDPKYARLIKILDSGFEIPYASSTNIESELEKAFSQNSRKKGLSLSEAKTGDDKYLVIKQDGQIQRVVGIDARGLGNLNMMTILNQTLDHYGQKGKISNVEEIFSISMKAIKEADATMDKSMDTYTKLLKAELEVPRGRNVNQMIRQAHDNYYQVTLDDDSFMKIRSAAITGCGESNECVMNKITAIHNRLKVLEKSGIDHHFGVSCLGTEYWLRKMGLVRIYGN